MYQDHLTVEVEEERSRTEDMGDILERLQQGKTDSLPGLNVIEGEDEVSFKGFAGYSFLDRR